MKIAVAGTGYVGLSLATLLAQKNEVMALDVIEEKVKLINDRISPIQDTEISDFLANRELNLLATLDKELAYKDSEFIVVATPTNYDTETNKFDTRTVELVLADVNSLNTEATIVIKSTIPVGYTRDIREKYPNLDIIFSPEFLREGKALYDNLYPSRIIVGEESKRSKLFGDLLVEASLKEDVDLIMMDSTEAEAVKLFSNTYLALRVAYFNELDTYCEINDLSSGNIIKGVSKDPRIGDYYNNPSFGYGGYCLPKDTKQLKANFKEIPNNMIDAIVDSNSTRKDHIANMIASKNPNVVGIYRLVMKTGSDNFRDAAILDVTKRLLEKNIEVVIYEPCLEGEELEGCKVVNNIDAFTKSSDVIVANRIEEELKEVKDKVYTRDIFTRD